MDATELVNGVLAQVEVLRDENQIAEAERLAHNVIAAAVFLPADYVATMSNRLLSPIAPEADPASDQVEMALRLLAHIAPVPEGNAALSNVSESWANQIRSGGVHDDRCLLRGFRALESLASNVVAQKASPIYTQVEQLINANDDVSGRLRTLAVFPWPDANVAGTLNHLQARWDAIPDDARVDALRLSSRAPDGFGPLTFFNERVAELTRSAPSGAYATIATANLPRMTLNSAPQCSSLPLVTTPASLGFGRQPATKRPATLSLAKRTRLRPGACSISCRTPADRWSRANR